MKLSRRPHPRKLFVHCRIDLIEFKYSLPPEYWETKLSQKDFLERMKNDGIFFWLLTYRIPFEDENILSLYNKIRTQTLKVCVLLTIIHEQLLNSQRVVCKYAIAIVQAQVQVPEDADVSAELLDLLNKMLIKKPCERFATTIIITNIIIITIIITCSIRCW